MRIYTYYLEFEIASKCLNVYMCIIEAIALDKPENNIGRIDRCDRYECPVRTARTQKTRRRKIEEGERKKVWEGLAGYLTSSHRQRRESPAGRRKDKEAVIKGKVAKTLCS